MDLGLNYTRNRATESLGNGGARFLPPTGRFMAFVGPQSA